MKLRESNNLLKKSKRLIPGSSQTFSKGHTQFVQGTSPIFLERGQGSHVWDVDGNEYIDYPMGLGPVILGHNYPAVTNAVTKILKKSNTFTLPHRLEVELAELLSEIIPCAEMVRFGKNGSDVTSGAVKVARAFTGRDKVACSGYHGWQDWYIVSTSMRRGIPERMRELTLPFEYNDIESLKKIFAKNKGEIACVIMEPVKTKEPEDNFLQEVKRLTHKNGALLIFDEIVTGFRYALGGGQEYFNVIPDLACFGKAMGNGFPISAIVGKKEIMKLFEEVFFSFTFGGEISSIGAAIATIEELRKKGAISHIWRHGERLRDGYNSLVKEHGVAEYTQCVGFPSRNLISFKDKKGNDDLLLKSLFQQECIKRGILFTGLNLISFSHSRKDIDYTLDVFRKAMGVFSSAVKSGNVRNCIKGKPVKPVFRRV